MSREIEDLMRKNANALKKIDSRNSRNKERSMLVRQRYCIQGFRGKGAANYLLKTMIMKAKSIFKVKHLLLSCHSTNSRGLAFYHKHGFKPIDMRITNLDEQKIITIQMKLEI
ncbi:N-acetyltransferase [Paenibacillus sp. 276b]|uniref:GNAT family N-acetyltransferase n=1 Tax=Paenibacillus sp. 276b TaxID=1566277 RepID=UPI000B84C9C9|nr:GNAT family N-acetyltransferase [Paenibacillus sp. 276b]